MATNKKKGVTRRQVLKGAAVLGAGAALGFPGILRASKNPEIRVGFITGAHIHQWLLPLGIGKNFFKEDGLEVKAKEYTSAGMMGPHLAVGEMDIGLMGLASVMLARAQGSDIQVIGTQNQGGSAFLVAPEITKFEDLKDKPVAHPGVGAVQYVLLSHLMDMHKTKVKGVTVKPSDMPVFAKNKEILGAQIFEPFCSMIVQSVPGWRRLNLDTDYLPGNQCCVIAVSKKYAAANPGVVDKIMVAHAKTTKYFIQHQAPSVEIISKVSGHDPKVTAEAYKYMAQAAPWPPWVNSKTAMITADWMVQYGQIKKDVIDAAGGTEKWWQTIYDPTHEQKLVKSGIIDKLTRDGIPA